MEKVSMFFKTKMKETKIPVQETGTGLPPLDYAAKILNISATTMAVPRARGS